MNIASVVRSLVMNVMLGGTVTFLSLTGPMNFVPCKHPFTHVDHEGNKICDNCGANLGKA